MIVEKSTDYTKTMQSPPCKDQWYFLVHAKPANECGEH